MAYKKKNEWITPGLLTVAESGRSGMATHVTYDGYIGLNQNCYFADPSRSRNSSDTVIRNPAGFQLDIRVSSIVPK